MKLNWILIAGSILVIAAVFGLTVVDGMNSVDRPAAETVQLVAR